MTFTRLNFGTPKFRIKPRYEPIPIVVASPCTDGMSPLNTNLAISADDFVATYSTTTIPQWQDAPTVPSWTVASTANWAISSSNPHSGTYHFRRTHNSATNAPIISMLTYRCDLLPDTELHDYSSANVLPGMTVSASLWCMRSNTTAANTLVPRFTYWADGVADAIGDDIHTSGLVPTSYTQYEVESSVPAGAEYLSFSIFITTPSSPATPNGTTFDVDDIVLTLSA